MSDWVELGAFRGAISFFFRGKRCEGKRVRGDRKVTEGVKCGRSARRRRGEEWKGDRVSFYRVLSNTVPSVGIQGRCSTLERESNKIVKIAAQGREGCVLRR